MNTNENIIDKLKYLGLDMEEIPEAIKRFRPLEYRPLKYNDEHIYKVYKYLDVKDIQILLTPTNRLCSIIEKYKKAVPLYEYLDSEREENIERYTKFLSMVSEMDIKQIEKIEQEQKLLNKEIPFKVKYPKDYLWQIYYSEYTNEYFMLVTTEDLEYSAFFYLLKKQLENKKDEKIFVPISHIEYTGEYLSRTQIADIENYIWLFTKKWPIVYEIHDKNNNLNLSISGKAYVFDDIQSDYRIDLKSKEEAIKFYKLLKALFIMQTEMPHRFNFSLGLNEHGSLEFYTNGKKIIYEILASLIKEEYLKAEEEKIRLVEEKLEAEKELDELQKKSSKLEKEYLEREKQIATYLVCKKTFFGRVKYFFKYKKVNLVKKEDNEEKKQEIKVIRLNKYEEVKSNYTLEELIELYKQMDKEEIKEKNLKSDIKAMKRRINNLESRVNNAVLYIEEIDKHKKSIFEFWKFTNKDKQVELPEGIVEQTTAEKLKKIFDYELDFEDLASSLDKTQRELLTRQELDSIYLTTTEILEDINKVANNEKISEERISYIKEKFSKENKLSDKENFDIFGGAFDNTIKTLANQKHRETKREAYNILNVNKSTTIEEYSEEIGKTIENIRSGLNKIKIGIDLPVYKCTLEEKMQNQFNIFSIRGEQAIKEIKNPENKRLNLYKIKLKENTNVAALTNIVYYDNINKTLPLGMNVEQGVLLDNNEIKLKMVKEEKINVLRYKEEKNEIAGTYIETINVKEFEIEE